MKEKVVIISGGSRGLGAAVVGQCLAAGWRTAAFSRSQTPFIKNCQKQHPQHFLWQAVDARDPAALRAFVKATVQQFGAVHALVNNAGVGSFGGFALMRQAELDQSIDLNIRGAMLLSQACVRAMLARKDQNGGAIVQISSVNALRGNSGVAVYSATKAALDGFTRALARELGPAGIRVNSVAPGYFESEMTGHLSEKERTRISRRTPLGRLGREAEIAAAVLFLLSNKASFITGQTLVVDGGITC